MTLYPTIADIIRFAKEADINSEEIYIAAELLIRGKKVEIHGMINLSTRNLLVKNGQKKHNNQCYKSFGPGTRIASIL